MFIVCLLLIFIIVAYVIYSYNKELTRNKRKMSFKESLDLAELPVVTFYQDNKKFNFLLDSGSNYSHIDENTAKSINGEIIASPLKITGLGEASSDSICRTVLTYKDKKFKVDLHISEMFNTFENIKKETGVQIHGILGNKFFQRYKYVLDFEELCAYVK